MNRKPRRKIRYCSNCGRARKGVLLCVKCGNKLRTRRFKMHGRWYHMAGNRFVTREDYDLARGKAQGAKKAGGKLVKPASSKIVIPRVSTTMISNLDAWSSTDNFNRVCLGPGIYVLIDGRASDGNIIYIGKSEVSIIMRVSSHSNDKYFDKVGVVLPRTCHSAFIHNLEASLMEEFVESYGEFPFYNKRQEYFVEGTRVMPWRSVARRKNDLQFV